MGLQSRYCTSKHACVSNVCGIKVFPQLFHPVPQLFRAAAVLDCNIGALYPFLVAELRADPKRPEQAFLFAHKNLLGGNHKDGLFGGAAKDDQVDGPQVTIDYYASDFAYPNAFSTTPHFNFVKHSSFDYSLNGKEFLVP